MKELPKPAVSLSRFLFYGLIFIAFLGVTALALGQVKKPVVEDPALEILGQNSETLTREYKAALETRKDFVQSEIKQTENLLIDEESKDERGKLVNLLRDQRNQYDELSDKIRMINAGEVVKLSNTKDKVLAFLTHQ